MKLSNLCGTKERNEPIIPYKTRCEHLLSQFPLKCERSLYTINACSSTFSIHILEIRLLGLRDTSSVPNTEATKFKLSVRTLNIR